jgi:hypothetical protein
LSRKRLYIAYGSNLNLPQMAFRCPSAKPVGTSELKGYELLFRGGRHGGVATVEPKEGSNVPILVWDIKPDDEIALDRYEGYPSFYDKQRMDIELNGKAVSAMVYVMTPGHEAGYPSRHYLNVIAEGYTSAGFDHDILSAAIERTGEVMEEEMQRQSDMENESADGQCSLFDMKWW